MTTTTINPEHLSAEPFGAAGWVTVFDAKTRAHVYMTRNLGESRAFIAMQRDPALDAAIKAIDLAEINEGLRACH